jgi:hypothetical protein
MNKHNSWKVIPRMSIEDTQGFQDTTPTQIEIVINQLSHQVEILTRVSECYEVRLNPLVRDTLPKNDNKKEPHEPLVPLARKLTELLEEIQTSVEMLDSLLGRLEI